MYKKKNSATCSTKWETLRWAVIVGVCVDAVKRARKIVPFAINLEASMVFTHGGKDCPCFEQNA